LVGNQYTLADINVLPILFYVNRFAEGSAALKSTKNLGTYFERHNARPSFKATVPPPPPGR
jgi:glutathione S-transferase